MQSGILCKQWFCLHLIAKALSEGLLYIIFQILRFGERFKPLQ
jgi:hypothetical protein